MRDSGPPDLTRPDFPMNVPIAEATARLAALLPARSHERVPLTEAYGRVLAEDLAARVNHPSATESALDGIACREADTREATPDAPARLTVVGESRAGAPFTGTVHAGEAVLIYTGAPLPPGADAICPVEKLHHENDTVLLRHPASPQDVRHEGSDFRAGEVVLRAGQTLTPHRVALAAALGHDTLPVRRKLRVALLTTGDEIIPPGQPLAPGQVYDSNRYGLVGLVRAAGHEPVALGQAPDTPAALAHALHDAGGADLILTTGGVSMGRYDLIRDLLIQEGSVAYWKVRVRPGGPAMLGVWRGTPLFGLPGNPVSSLVVFEVIVKPALTGREPRTVRVRAATPFKSVPGKTAYWRGVLHGGAVTDYGRQGSGVLRSLSDANALVIIPEGQRVHEGDDVDVILLD